MTRRSVRWMPALTVVAMLGATGSSEGQELRRDARFDGVLIAAGTGAAAGVVLSVATEEICSPGACAYLGSVVGGLIGLLVDSRIGQPRPVAPGAFIDDGIGDGALAGALGGAAFALVEAVFRCRPGPDRGPCTRKGILLDMSVAARWMAIVGLLIDAAIPSQLQDPSGTHFERSPKRFGVRFNLRF